MFTTVLNYLSVSHRLCEHFSLSSYFLHNRYALTEYNTIKDLNNFKQFLKRNFKELGKLDDMLPTSNQPARIYASAKTHKFASVDSVNINDLKFRWIIYQTGTMI